MVSWVAASGVSGVKTLKIPLHLGKTPAEAEIRKFTIRLSFVEPNEAAVGDRVFDVSIQGNAVLTDFDVVKRAEGSHRVVVEEFGSIEASNEIAITFNAKNGQPLISGVEIVEEAD